MKCNAAILAGRKYFWPTALSLLALLTGCREGDIRPGSAPETQMSYDTINLAGNNRLNTTVRLSWYGTDEDGYVKGFEVSQDQENWDYTTRQDSTFSFDIPAGNDSVDIDFYVRAVDNTGQKDPSPAYLQVPLRNSAPEAFFIDDRGPQDTAFVAATFFWNAQDPDGNNSLAEVQLRANEGPWTTVNLGEPLLSLVPVKESNSGPIDADIFYGTNTTASGTVLKGLRINDTNRLQVRAIDIAGKMSPVDTSPAFYFRGKTPGVDMLWINGHNGGIRSEYKGYLEAAGLNYDLYDLGGDQGAKIPAYFDPTVQLVFKEYQTAFLNLSNTSYGNPVTGVSSTLLDFLAPVVQRFTDRGGKYFLTTSFPKDADVSNTVGVYPFSGLVLSSQPGSQARITTDSALVPVNSNSYPRLEPSNVEFGIVPIEASSDAQRFYRAQLTKFRGWNGSTDLMATVRRPSNQLTEVFFAQELHRYDSDPNRLHQLIGDIFKNEF